MTKRFFNSLNVYFFKVVKGAFGGLHPGQVFGVVIGLTSISLFTEAVIKLWLDDISPYWSLLPLSLLALIAFWFYWTKHHLRPKIIQFPARPAKAIVWFLSPKGSFSGDEFGTWRMPYEAISFQQKKGRLKKVVVITSSDEKGKENGTYRVYDDFRNFLNTTGIDLSELTIAIASSYPKGVDFVEGQELDDAIESVYKDLKEEGYKEHEIILDCTGGFKVPTIFGTVATLFKKRRLQYVSTLDKKIIEYDISYVSDEE